MVEITDEQLVQQYFAGDEASLSILIERYLKPIYNFSYRLVGSPTEAEDVTQEIFIKMWRHLKKFDLQKSFRTWLFTIAKNTALDFLKKKKEIPFSEFDDEEGGNYIIDTVPDPSPLPAELFEKKDLADKLNSAISQLPRMYQVVLSLYFYNQLNFREIAETLGEPIDTVKSRHRRALIALKKILVI